MSQEVRRKAATAVLALISAGFAVWWARRRRAGDTVGSQSASADRELWRLDTSTPPSVMASVMDSKGPRRDHLRRDDSLDSREPAFWPALVAAASFALGLLGGFAFTRRNWTVVAGISLLTAMALCAFVLRGPKRHNKKILTVIAILLMYIEVLIFLGFAVSGEQSGDAVRLLEVTLFCLGAAGVIVSLAATWLRSWRFFETLAIGFVAIAIGALCLPGLSLLTARLTPPAFTGDGLLFATGRPDQGLDLHVGIVGDQNQIGESGPSREIIQVTNSAKQPVHWALLVDGGARMHSYTISSSGVKVVDLTASGQDLNVFGSAAGQLFFGMLNGGASVTLEGVPAETYYNSTSDQTAVTFPSYGQGILSGLNEATGAAVVKGLRGPPVVRNESSFTAQITSSPIAALDSITTVSLSPVPDPSQPATLEWTFHNTQSIDYTVQNQGAASASSNLLVAFAVLLGIAGAGIVATLQTMVQAILHTPQD